MTFTGVVFAIHSPQTWLGEEFVNKYRYASAEAMQVSFLDAVSHNLIFPV